MVFENHKAALVVTDTGVWLFNATGTLELNAPEKWDTIPVEKRDSRAVIKAAGDAYFDHFGNVSVAVPWRAPIYRLEGGLPAKGLCLCCERVWAGWDDWTMIRLKFAVKKSQVYFRHSTH